MIVDQPDVSDVSDVAHIKFLNHAKVYVKTFDRVDQLSVNLSNTPTKKKSIRRKSIKKTVKSISWLTRQSKFDSNITAIRAGTVL